MSTLVSLKNISKAFYGIRALSDISLDIRKGETLGMIGENGAGKSTLMNILGGNVRADSGSITLRGISLMLRGDRPMPLMQALPLSTRN